MIMFIICKSLQYNKINTRSQVSNVTNRCEPGANRDIKLSQTVSGCAILLPLKSREEQRADTVIHRALS